MKFSKYHGLGNDFIIIMHSNEIEENIEELVKRLCNRHIGIGADGLILVKKDPQLEMVIYNCDGSKALMCGNGIRCFINYLITNKFELENNLKVKTEIGNIEIQVLDNATRTVKVNMQRPNYSLSLDMLKSEKSTNKVVYKKHEYLLYSIFQTTMHSILFIENFSNIEQIGEYLSNHYLFPQKSNIDFVKIIDKESIEVKTYERGVGLTKSCGSGNCASAAVCYKLGLVNKCVKVINELGSIDVLVDDYVYMIGNSNHVFDGEI